MSLEVIAQSAFSLAGGALGAALVTAFYTRRNNELRLVHEQRAAAVKELNKLMWKFRQYLNYQVKPNVMSNPGATRTNEILSHGIPELDVIQDCYLENRIYFNDRTCKAIEETKQLLNDCFLAFQNAELPHAPETKYMARNAALVRLSEMPDESLLRLQDEFRLLLRALD